LWREGMLHLAAFHLLLIPVAIWAIRRRALTALVWLAAAIWTFLFASNTSVVQSRHFVMSAVFAAPLIAIAIDRATAWLEGAGGAGAPRRRGVRGAIRPGLQPRHRVRRPLAAATLPVMAVVLAAFQIADLLP